MSKFQFTMDACYFCTTPFQILSSLSLVKAMGEKADMYIMPQFSHAEDYGEKIRKTGAFRHVKVVDEPGIIHKYFKHRNGLINHLEIARSYLFVDEITKMVLEPGVFYSKMYVSSRAYTGRVVQMHLIKHRIPTEIIYYDDGEGSYVNDATYKPRKTDAIVRQILFGRKANDTNRTKYLYSPEFYHLLNPGTEQEDVRPLPFFTNDNAQKNYINSVFDYEDQKNIHADCIILDTLRDGFEPMFNQFLLGLYGEAADTVGRERTSIKCHPRDTMPKEPGFQYYNNTSIPFEVLCLNMNMNQKVLVAISSTAAVIPKLLLDQEPFVIMLYKMTDRFQGKEPASRRYYEQCKNLYRNKERFMIPNTMEEFHDMLRQIKDVMDTW